ncbi:MAG: hypothetical protein ABI548_09950 [Polyangiaceae bacterium]
MTSAGDVMQMALVAGVPVAVAAASYVGVVRHTAQVPPESPLSSLHGRALATGIVLLLVAAATVNLGFAFEARTRAIALPVGPGWAPDLGLDEIVRAGVWGVIATTLSGLYLLVAAVLDALGAAN